MRWTGPHHVGCLRLGPLSPSHAGSTPPLTSGHKILTHCLSSFHLPSCLWHQGMNANLSPHFCYVLKKPTPSFTFWLLLLLWVRLQMPQTVEQFPTSCWHWNRLPSLPTHSVEGVELFHTLSHPSFIPTGGTQPASHLRCPLSPFRSDWLPELSCISAGEGEGANCTWRIKKECWTLPSLLCSLSHNPKPWSYSHHPWS